MKFELLLNSTTPRTKEKFWQFVVFPTISIYSSCSNEHYYAIMAECWYWSVTVIIHTNDTKRSKTEGIC